MLITQVTWRRRGGNFVIIQHGQCLPPFFSGESAFLIYLLLNSHILMHKGKVLGREEVARDAGGKFLSGKMRISVAVFQNFRPYFIFSEGKESTLLLEIFTEYLSNREEKSWKFLRNYVD